jgi:3'(2'), 5'-bisphosphate nucleotidase
MILDTLGPEAVLAIEAVRGVVRFMRDVQRTDVSRAITKVDASPATILDFAVQALLIAGLERDFKSDSVVAEEDAAALRLATNSDLRDRVVALVRQQTPDVLPEQVLAAIDRGRGACGARFWTVDPIDGTKGLLRGGQYAVAVALIEDGIAQLGILGCPHLSLSSARSNDGDGGVAVAVRGQGSWWLPLDATRLSRLSVSSVSDVVHARVVHSYESAHEDTRRLRDILRRLETIAEPIGIDGQAKHVLIASGAAELLLRVPADPGYHEAIWDHAAGSLIIEEAGGRVTDLNGRPLDLTTGRRLARNTGVLASNGFLHDAVLAVIGGNDIR